MLDATALIIWDIGTRPPRRLLTDMRVGMHDRTILLVGILRFLAGAIILALGVISAFPLVRHRGDFSIVQVWIMIAALVVEQIVGEDVRSRITLFKG